jgi:hypothetical protein
MADTDPGRTSEQRSDRSNGWRHGPWLGGVILIVLGVIFLLQNFGYPLPENWWAVFILIPAAAAFSSAWSLYERAGRRITAGVRGAAIGGTILTVLAAVFFFGVDFGKFWPVILIALGVAAIAGGFWRNGNRPTPPG